MGYEQGGAVSITTSGDGINHTVADVQQKAVGVLGSAISTILDKLSALELEVKYLLLIGDAGNGSNTILVGPNGCAVFPISASQAIPLQFVDPARIAYNDQGTASLKFYVLWGAVSDRWLRAREAKRQSVA